MAKKKRKPAPRKEKPETPAEAAADNSNAGTARTDLNSEATGHPFESMAPAGHEEHTGAHNALLGVYSANSGNPDGAYIARVISESPAASGGLAQGDVITKINETAINNSDELVATIGMYHPGDKVTVTYMRNGSTDQAQVTLGDKTMAEEQNEQPMYHNWEDNQDNNQDFNNNSNQNNSNQGMGNNNWNRYSYNQFRNYHKPVQLGISATDGRHPRGVYLDEVKAGSPAEIAGLQKGDIITRVAGERVRFAYEMQELLRMPGIGTVIDIDYRHDGQKMHTQVRVENNNRENRQYHHGYDDQRNYEDQRNY